MMSAKGGKTEEGNQCGFMGSINISFSPYMSIQSASAVGSPCLCCVDSVTYECYDISESFPPPSPPPFLSLLSIFLLLSPPRGSISWLCQQRRRCPFQHRRQTQPLLFTNFCLCSSPGFNLTSGKKSRSAGPLMEMSDH